MHVDIFYPRSSSVCIYRTVELAVNNQKLREQVRESQETIQRLMEDVQELTFGWEESQARLEEKERAWQEKMETQTSKSAQSHQTSLSACFQDVASTKDQFNDVTASIYK